MSRLNLQNGKPSMTELRKLAAILTQLREAAKSEGRNCVAIYERNSTPQAVKVFASTAAKPPLPNDLIHRFWVGRQ